MSVKLFRTDNQITDASGKFIAVGDFNSNEWISEEDFVNGLPTPNFVKVTNQSEFDEAIGGGFRFLLFDGSIGNINADSANGLKITIVGNNTTNQGVNSFTVSGSNVSVELTLLGGAWRFIDTKNKSASFKVYGSSIDTLQLNGADGSVEILNSTIGFLQAITSSDTIDINSCYVSHINTSGGFLVTDSCTIGRLFMNNVGTGTIQKTSVQVCERWNGSDYNINSFSFFTTGSWSYTSESGTSDPLQRVSLVNVTPLS